MYFTEKAKSYKTVLMHIYQCLAWFYEHMCLYFIPDGTQNTCAGVQGSNPKVGLNFSRHVFSHPTAAHYTLP
jgi:hypothetical protein